MRGTTLSEVPGLFGESHDLALAANSGTMVDGALTILLDIGSSIDIISRTGAPFPRTRHREAEPGEGALRGGVGARAVPRHAI
eukprot:9105859-Pyramimonas_sp.AAC.1